MRTQSYQSIVMAIVGFTVPAACNAFDPPEKPHLDSATTATGTESNGPDSVGPPTGTDPTANLETTVATVDPTGGPESTGGWDDTVGSDSTGDVDSTTSAFPPLACGDLGGVDGITALVKAFHQEIRDDIRINAYFLNSDFVGGKFEACLVQQIAEAASCPDVRYACEAMKTAHEGLRISAIDHTDFVEDFSTALDAHEASLGTDIGAIKVSIVAMLNFMAADIVEDESNNQSVYQRVGRNPALVALLGEPSLPGTFLGRLTSNAALSGFFMDNLDGPRLNTCYSRKLGGLPQVGGPMKYGLEATLMPQCADIESKHENKTNMEMGDAPITIGDFAEMLVDLDDAMATIPSFLSVAPADKTALREAMSSLCENIVATPNECDGTSEMVEVAGEVGAPQSILDYDGVNAVPLCIKIPVPMTEINYLDDARVRLKIAHTWAGDLTITLTTPTDQTLKLLARPGVLPPNNLVGYGAVLDPTLEVTFSDSGAWNAATMGKNYSPGQKVCVEEKPCEFFPPQIPDPIKSFSALGGTAVAGDWELCITDESSQNVGKVHGVVLEVDKVKYKP